MARNTPDREFIPIVQKVRLQYAKRGALKFSSHRDFQRSFERAVRRVGVPMAYSAGFNPHPKISYANAAPTGTASEAEYVEIGLAERVDVQKLLIALQPAMPTGLAIVDAVEAQSSDFVERLEASLWKIVVPEVSETDLNHWVEAFSAQSEILVTRKTKNGPRTFDARQAVVNIEVIGSEMTESGLSCAILRVVVRHLTPAVRPDDVLNAIAIAAQSEFPVIPRITRLAQGPLSDDNASVTDPLAVDRR
jgi:radical SAM-linked protein